MRLFRQSPRVDLYTTPNCPDCAAVKLYLDRNGVAYREKDVTSDSRYLQEMQRAAGVRIAPVTVVAGQAFYGTFDTQRAGLETALQAQGLIREQRGQ